MRLEDEAEELMEIIDLDEEENAGPESTRPNSGIVTFKGIAEFFSLFEFEKGDSIYCKFV